MAPNAIKAMPNAVNPFAIANIPPIANARVISPTINADPLKAKDSPNRDSPVGSIPLMGLLWAKRRVREFRYIRVFGGAISKNKSSL